MMVADKHMVRGLYPERHLWCHKGNFGSLLVIGGSELYSGSPALSAISAIRSGVDLVTVAAPRRPADIIAGFGPDMITHPLKGGSINPSHLKELLLLSNRHTAAVIGGGMGRQKPALEAAVSFLSAADIPCVVDADAIHAVAMKPSCIKRNFIITPHSHEFSVLSGRRVSHDINERVREARSLARKLGATVLLKGHIDVITDGRNCAINETGSTFMTKGGTGDTLAGICGSLLARGAHPFEAACAAAWINGTAGSLAAEEFGEGLMAMDVARNVHRAIKLALGGWKSK